MIKRAACMLAALVCLAHGALAQTLTPAPLTPAGTDLGRVAAKTLTDGLSITVDIGEDVPTATHLIVRFQNNQPLMRGADGLWATWNGDPQRLDEAGAVAADRKLVFQIFPRLPDAFFYPVSFTVAYETAGGVKSGTLTVDGP